MNVIAVECPACRLIESVEPGCLLLEIDGAEADDEKSSSASWICDGCHRLVALPIDLVVLLHLVAAGSSLLDTAPEDDEVAYPETATYGLPLTLDDLIDFHQILDDEAAFAAERCRELPENCP